MKSYRLKMFKDDSPKHQWRWDLVAPNGEIVAGSAGDGYHNRRDCIRIWRLIFPWISVSTLRGLPPERIV